MPLRNQPYLPLYVQDVISDEKLIECSAEAHGVYFRLICGLHKSEQYGTILLKQKYKQSPDQIKNFALQLAKSFPFDLLMVEKCLRELVDEKVLHIDGDSLFQKRMVKDNDISEKRAVAGKKGGDRTTKKKDQTDYLFAKAKKQANPENESEYENEIENEDKDKGKGVGKPLRWEDDLIYPFDSELFKTNWKAHREMREAKHKEYLTRDSEQASLMAISRLTKNETEAIQIIQQSLANGWQDFFKLKTDGKQQTTIDRRDQSKQDTSDAVARHYAERLASEKGGTGV